MSLGGPDSALALILAPTGRDARLAATLLDEAGCASLDCRDTPGLVEAVRAGAGLAIVAEEAVTAADLTGIAQWVAEQPAWSDFPFLILTRRGGVGGNPLLRRLSAVLGNVTFIERPFHPSSFASTVRSALRGRMRQYEARARIEELQWRERQLRIAQEVGAVGSFELFPSTGRIDMSDEFCRLFGLTPRPFAHISDLYRLVHPEDRLRLETDRSELPSEALQYTEYRITRPDNGELRWLARRGERVEDAHDPQTARYLGVVYDITELKLAQQLLQTNELALRRLNETLETRVAERTRDRDRMWRLSADIMLVARFNGEILGVNPAWASLLGWPEHELIGRLFLELVHPDDLPSTMAEVGRLAQGLTTLRFENRYRHRDGSFRHISWTAVPEADLIQAVGRDMTAEHEQAEALRQTEDALRQSQKMEAVGQLTGGIAHDFNNLLQGIVGALELVKKRIADGRTAELDRFVGSAMGSAQRAAALTHRLLAFSRRQPLDPKTVHANPLVASMEDLLRRTLGERIVLRLKLAEGLWPTLCDPNQLESAVLNLAINARDAMPDPGTLTIETRNVQLGRADTARRGDIAPGPYVCIAVTDTGIGMPADVAARAFDPFFTTKPLGQGTGLGLSMIYGFTRQSGGFCEIDSKPGAGTTVRLYTPQHIGPSVDDVVTESAPLWPSDDGEVVVIVEDDAVVRSLIVDLLSDLGYRTLEAADGAAGVALLEQMTTVDLLLTDVGLPKINGRQLADAARERWPALKVLFMTGYAEQAAVAGGMLDHGMEIIAKPFAMDALAAKVRSMLKRR